jgi:hypothetical protein
MPGLNRDRTDEVASRHSKYLGNVGFNSTSLARSRVGGILGVAKKIKINQVEPYFDHEEADPTVGRRSLNRAVQTVLDQTRPVCEVIVVADTDEPVTLPPDDRIKLLHNPFRQGPAKCRQLGI